MRVIYARRPASRLELLLLRLVRSSSAVAPPVVRVDFVATEDVDAT